MLIRSSVPAFNSVNGALRHLRRAVIGSPWANVGYRPGYATAPATCRAHRFVSATARVCRTVNDTAASVEAELRQILQELGLADAVRVE